MHQSIFELPGWTGAQATASSSLFNMSMHVQASTQLSILYPVPANAPVQVTGAITEAMAYLNETLTFDVPDSLKGQTQYGTFTLHIDGSSNANMLIGTAMLGAFDYSTSAPTQWHPIMGGTDNATLSVTVPISQPFHDYSDAVTLNAELLFAGNVRGAEGCGAAISNGVSFDYGDTAWLTMNVPDGVTFTSTSGVAFSQPYVETVPEGDTARLLALPLMMLVLVRIARARRFG
jgi:hypothetical protein